MGKKSYAVQPKVFLWLKIVELKFDIQKTVIKLVCKRLIPSTYDMNIVAILILTVRRFTGEVNLKLLVT